MSNKIKTTSRRSGKLYEVAAFVQKRALEILMTGDACIVMPKKELDKMDANLLTCRKRVEELEKFVENIKKFNQILDSRYINKFIEAITPVEEVKDYCTCEYFKVHQDTTEPCMKCGKRIELTKKSEEVCTCGVFCRTERFNRDICLRCDKPIKESE